jgi:hypothetical protein
MKSNKLSAIQQEGEHGNARGSCRKSKAHPADSINQVGEKNNVDEIDEVIVPKYLEEVFFQVRVDYVGVKILLSLR